MSVVALSDGKLFQRLSATRHRCQSAAFVLSFHYLEGAAEESNDPLESNPPIFLGFVLPKKLVKRAVDRNQIKRWVRNFLGLQRVQKPCAMVIRAKVKMRFASATRSAIRDELAGLMDRGLCQIDATKHLGTA
ncbi:MAG: ribonuclease P protein component [Burkholderiaceae bacterium]